MQPSSSNDTIKHLIKSASILVRKLDSSNSKPVRECKELFSTDLLELRSQLSQLCIKSIIADPVQCRRKAEELLWRKCFYGVISNIKTNAKKSLLTDTDKFYIESHIDSGIARFSEQLESVLLQLNPAQTLVAHILPLDKSNLNIKESNEAQEDLQESAQRMLVWLGDLCRYKHDLGISNSFIVAHRFYHQAILIKPMHGLPFNQLGTLTSQDDSRVFEAIFFYIRSIVSPKTFLGAESNLKSLLERLAGNQDHLISSFALLVSKLFLKQNEENNYEIAQLCQENLGYIQTLLDGHGGSSSLLDITAVMVLCTSHACLTSKSQSTAGTAFCFSVFDSVLRKFQAFFTPGVEEEEAADRAPEKADDTGEIESEDEDELKRAKMMRRRKIGSDSDDFSDEEDEMSLNLDSDYSDSEEEVLSDSGFHSAETKPEVQIELPAEVTSLLPVLKMLTDWFQTSPKTLQQSSQSVSNFWPAVSIVLNNLKRCQRDAGQSPLEEDWKFYGYEPMRAVHAQLNFHESVLVADADALRVERILQFGHWLSQNEVDGSVKFENGVFLCSSSSGNQEEKEDKSGLMKNMAQLWLKSEVQELERKLVPSQNSRRRKRTDGSAPDLMNLPYVYVVPDACALSKHTHLIKKMIKSQKVIVVIPDVVVSEMDQLKKDNQSVRDCIRWMETCFRNGNRFVRAQRQKEHKTIPLIAYPKRKDRENWVVFQILECCHYLDTQQRSAYNNDQNTPIVLFLCGQMIEGSNPNIRGVCTSIGVDLKSVDSIGSKRNSSK